MRMARLVADKKIATLVGWPLYSLLINCAGSKTHIYVSVTNHSRGVKGLSTRGVGAAPYRPLTRTRSGGGCVGLLLGAGHQFAETAGAGHDVGLGRQLGVDAPHVDDDLRMVLVDAGDALGGSDEAHHDELGDLAGVQVLVAGDDGGERAARGEHRIGDDDDGAGANALLCFAVIVVHAGHTAFAVGFAACHDVMLVDETLVDDVAREQEFMAEEGGAHASADDVDDRDGHARLDADAAEALVHAGDHGHRLAGELVGHEPGEQVLVDEAEEPDRLEATRLAGAELRQPRPHESAARDMDVCSEISARGHWSEPILSVWCTKNPVEDGRFSLGLGQGTAGYCRSLRTKSQDRGLFHFFTQ